MKEGGIPPFPGIRVMPVETNHYIAEILGVRIFRFEIFADTPQAAAELVETFDLEGVPPSYDHTSIDIKAAPNTAGEPIEDRQSERDRCAAGQWQYNG